MQLLVFGGTGFLGGRVITAGADRGYAVTATQFTSLPTAHVASVSEFHSCDMTDRAAVDRLVDIVNPDLVVNAAYIQSGPTASVVCGDAAGWVADACKRNNSQLVHVSTDLVFDGLLGHPYREDDSPKPLSAYGSAKLRGEELVAAALPSAAILRTSLIYGDPSAPQEMLVNRALHAPESEQTPIAFFTDEWRSPIHVDDLAAAILDLERLMERSRAAVGGVLNVAGSERVSRFQFAQLLAIHAGESPEDLTGRTQEPTLGPRPADVSLDVSRALQLGLTLPGASDRLGASSR